MPAAKTIVAGAQNAGRKIVVPAICPEGDVLEVPAEPNFKRVVRRMMESVYPPVIKQAGIKMGSMEEVNMEKNISVFTCGIEQYAAKNPRKTFKTCLKEWAKPTCTQGTAQKITEMAFECAVPTPTALNTHYESFSSEVYGETSLAQMASIIDELNLGPKDVFVDLGSGVGQLVCFTAAYSKVKKSVGVELSKKPAEYADKMAEYFPKLMKHFGKTHGEFELHQGSFLSQEFRKLILEEATVIFINNFAFTAELMNQINTELIQELPSEVRIVTSKPLSANKRGVSARSTNDISAILVSKPMKTMEGNVSWTQKKIEYTVTQVDWSRLEKFYEAQKKADEKRKARKRKNVDEGPSSKK